ncbi:uncharacterized protein LOC114542153 [Dendronephthya gigantea]|uniref:uncharacterized protein LOC114542153 n=1 Tax=Dendronephthya gigantea TaxID=151771 RepID=UPI00106CE59A|nr:uncharacterized protein LOC114542153 [Dendronephthya gigantea]
MSLLSTNKKGPASATSSSPGFDIRFSDSEKSSPLIHSEAKISNSLEASPSSISTSTDLPEEFSSPFSVGLSSDANGPFPDSNSSEHLSCNLLPHDTPSAYVPSRSPKKVKRALQYDSTDRSDLRCMGHINHLLPEESDMMTTIFSRFVLACWLQCILVITKKDRLLVMFVKF